MFLWNEHLHLVGSQVVMELVHNCATIAGSHLESIAQRRLYLPESRIESAHIHSKMPALSTDESDQIDIAVQNRGEFFTDSILEQRGDRQRRSTMEFKVRWLGYGPEHDSWEPYKNLAQTEQLILYSVRNRMRSLISKGHRSNFAPIGKE